MEWIRFCHIKIVFMQLLCMYVPFIYFYTFNKYVSPATSLLYNVYLNYLSWIKLGIMMKNDICILRILCTINSMLQYRFLSKSNFNLVPNTYNLICSNNAPFVFSLNFWAADVNFKCSVLLSAVYTPSTNPVCRKRT